MTHTAFLGDGEHAFALTPAMIVELERVTGLGIGALYRALIAGAFSFRHVVETIRLALIGGGMSPADAATLVRVYVEPRPLAETFPLALDVLDALWSGPKDVGEALATEDAAMAAALGAMP